MSPLVPPRPDHPPAAPPWPAVATPAAAGPATDGETLGPMFDQHPSPMLAIDPDDGRIVAANLAAARFYGWTVAELTAMTVHQLNTLPPEAIASEMQAAATEQRAYFAFQHRTADGTIVDVEVYSGPVEVGGRRVLGSVIAPATERHAAARARAAAESLADTIVAFAPIGIAVADLDGRLIRVNPAMVEITGYPPETLIGMDFRELTHPDDRPTAHTVHQKLRTSEQDHYRMEKRYLRADGTVVEVDASTTMLRDGRGAPRYQLGIVADLTSQRRAARAAEQAADRLRRTMEAVHDGIFIVDRDFTITYTNARFGSILGVDPVAAVGRNLWELFPAAIGAGFDHAFRAALATGETQIVVERFTPGLQWLEARAYRGEGELIVYVSDVTDRVNHQRRLEGIAQSERAAADRLRELDATKNAFLSAVSHELRTPLSVVRGLAETLAVRRAQLDPDTRVLLEDTLLHHTLELSELLDALLDVNRLSRGTIRALPEGTDLCQLIRDVVAASPIVDRTVVEAPARLPAEVDRVLISRLLSNLLTNAAKYAPDGPVTVTLERADDRRVRLAVRDRGPGIPVEQRARAFEAFFRLNDDDPQPGTGIGLTLVAEFARLHGGRARIDTPADGCGGTEVVVHFDTTSARTSVA